MTSLRGAELHCDVPDRFMRLAWVGTQVSVRGGECAQPGRRRIHHYKSVEAAEGWYERRVAEAQEGGYDISSSVAAAVSEEQASHDPEVMFLEHLEIEVREMVQAGRSSHWRIIWGLADGRRAFSLIRLVVAAAIDAGGAIDESQDLTMVPVRVDKASAVFTSVATWLKGSQVGQWAAGDSGDVTAAALSLYLEDVNEDNVLEAARRAVRA